MGYLFVPGALLILLAIESAKRHTISRTSPNSRHVPFVSAALGSTFVIIMKHGVALVSMPGWMEKAVCIKSMRRRHRQIEICTTARSSQGPIECGRRKTLTTCMTACLLEEDISCLCSFHTNKYGENPNEKSGPYEASPSIHGCG